MRLWHWQILKYLPKSQLLSQKRECDLIWKDIAQGKKTNHVLINYIWNYTDYKVQLASYYNRLRVEFYNRGFKFVDKCNLLSYEVLVSQPFHKHQNDRYLLQCFYNLQEKYDRGQKNFDKETYLKLENFIREKWLLDRKEF